MDGWKIQSGVAKILKYWEQQKAWICRKQWELISWKDKASKGSRKRRISFLVEILTKKTAFHFTEPEEKDEDLNEERFSRRTLFPNFRILKHGNSVFQLIDYKSNKHRYKF